MTKPTQDKETLREALIEVIHEGLGGNGWAYSYYGNNELNHMRDELGRAADAAIATMFERLRTPSQRMLDAAFHNKDEHMEDIWQAMLTAFQQENSECPSCGGLNTSCPDGCGRDPITGELNFSRLENSDAS